VSPAVGECSETDDMLKYCALSCRVCEPDEDEDACKDEHDNCAFWQSHGECEKNPVYMSKNCAKSCGTCELLEVDRELSDSTTENQRVSTKFGTMQTVKGSRSNDTATRLAESIAYMQSDQMTELPEKVRANCQNRNELCTFWAVIGEVRWCNWKLRSDVSGAEFRALTCRVPSFCSAKRTLHT
jgi:ShK domain-like